MINHPLIGGKGQKVKSLLNGTRSIEIEWKSNKISLRSVEILWIFEWLETLEMEWKTGKANLNSVKMEWKWVEINLNQ